jgi:ABC-type oligopeptide transport system ATPase subunit
MTEKKAFEFNKAMIIAELKEMFKCMVQLKKPIISVKEACVSNVNDRESIEKSILRSVARIKSEKIFNVTNDTNKNLSSNFEMAFKNRLAFFENKTIQRAREEIVHLESCRLQECESQSEKDEENKSTLKDIGEAKEIINKSLIQDAVFSGAREKNIKETQATVYPPSVEIRNELPHVIFKQNE